MTERRWDQVRWWICIVGLVVSIAVSLPGLKNLDIDIPPPEELRAPKPQYPVPIPEPRKEGFGFSRGFLFQLAGSDKLAGEERELQLMERYENILDHLKGGAIPEVAVETGPHTSTVTIGGSPFVTVLPQDCPEYFSRLDDKAKLELEEEVAYSWARVIQEDLLLENLKRDPGFLSLYNYSALISFFLISMAQLTLNWISHKFVKRPLWSLKLLMWVVYFTILTALHPSFDGVSNYLAQGALNPISDFIWIGVLMVLGHYTTRFVLHRYLEALSRFDHQKTERAALRRNTLAQAWSFVSKVGWTFLGMYLFFSQLGVDLAQFFAGAGLLGVAIGVMARDVFLDLFNGAYVLAEDQFVVGDWIESGSDAGEVVEFSLRSTKIRRADGSLAIIPNAELRRLRNFSYHHSTLDFRVTVCYNTDTDRAVELIVEEMLQLDAEWPKRFVAAPEPLGVQELGLTGVVLRVRVKTIPLAYREALRRVNRRVKKRFEKEGILLSGERAVSVVRILQHDQPWSPKLEQSTQAPQESPIIAEPSEA